MYQQHVISIKETVKYASEQHTVKQMAEQLFADFFSHYPEAQTYFADYDMAELGPRKFHILIDSLLDTLQYPDFAEDRLDEEVFRHLIHNLRDREYYFALLDALYRCIHNNAKHQWQPHNTEHWLEAIAGMKHMIDQGAKNHISEPV